MDTTFWEQVKVALGLDAPGAAHTAARFIQILVVALVTVLVSHWVRRRVERLTRTSASYTDAGVFASRAMALLIYIAGLTVALAIAGANWTVLATVLGAATFGLSLAFQDVAKNFVDGAYLLIERPFRHGDRIRIGDFAGRVEKFGVRHTTLRTASGSRVAVPNTIVFTSAVENATVGIRDHHEIIISGVAHDVIETAASALASLATGPNAAQAMVWQIKSIAPDSTEIALSVDITAGSGELNRLMQQVHTLFPEATIRSSDPADAE